jgi:hypothetical protein
VARNTGSQLRVSFLVDTGGLRSGFQKATKETDRFGKASNRSARATAGLGSALRGAALAAGGAAAAYISIAQAKQAITTTQELALATSGLNRNLGLATTEASKWAAVTRARGIDSKTLTMSFTALSRAIDGTRTGTESALRPFQALGISQKELTATGGNFQKQILLVADALGDAEGSSTRQASAAKLLGRGYRDLLPLFTEGSKGLQEQLKWADEFGATMGKGTVDAMMNFTTAQRRGRVAIMGLQIAFARFATPAITEAIEGLGQFAAVLNDPSLTKAQKLDRLRQEFERLRDRVISIIGDLVPIVAQSAGEIGVALAQGIAKGFLETGILGKVAISAFFIRAMGGPRAIITAGAAAGALFAKGQAAAMTNVYAYKNARAAGFGAMASSAALGTSIAGGLGKSLARAIPPVMAALAIGDILLTAIAGDMKGAAVKGGGALIGGALGAVFGPAGIAIGAGLGAIGAGMIQDIVGGAEREAPKMRERITASIGRLTAAAGREQAAYRQLASASGFLADSRKRQKNATDRVRDAERKLARARAQFGPSSEEAISAARRLANARRRVANETERVKTAERTYGALRKATKNDLRASVKDQKLELFTLRSKQRRLAGLVNDGKANLEQNREYIRITKAVNKGQRNLNLSYLEAGQKVGPKFANSLQRISGRTLSLKRDVAKLRSGIVLNSKGMSEAYVRALDRMLKKTGTSITILKSDAPNEVIGGNRRGGSITGSTGRSVMAAVSPGEMITYRGREVMVPGKPEPRDSVLMNLPVGSKVFTADGQARLAMGASESQALRDQAPHFAAGGIVRPQMVGGIPGQRRVANRGFGVVHKEALAYIRRNSLVDLAGAERLAAKFGLRVSSGYRPGDDGFHGVNRARDFAGDASDMYRFAKYVGTRFESKLLELIYSPLGWSIDNYRRVPPYAVADHYDHVHLAMRKGGRVTSNSPLKKKKRWGPNQLHTLAAAVGMPNPGLMAQIAQGESGGRANLNNAGLNSDGSVDYGLWQINSIHGKPVSGMLNPIQNALYAKEILASQGLGAWVAYSNGRYSGFSPGRFDEAFYYDLLYSGKSQRRALGAAKRKAGRIPGLRAAFRSRGGKAGTGRKLNKAQKAARKAVRLARLGDVGGSRAAGKRALGLTKAAAGGINAPGGGGNNDDRTPKVPALSYLDLPASVRRSLSFDDKIALLERDLAVAAGTATTKDDLAVLDAQIGLYKGLANRSARTIARTNNALAGFTDKKLAAARRKAKSKNKDRRKEGRAYLARYRKLTGRRSTAIGDLSTAEAGITSAKEAKGEVGGTADLASAMADLAAAIQEQNEIAKGVQATSSREAIRLLSDVISGQIVGKRISSTPTPQGVRY